MTSFHFDCGDSNKGPIGFCARIKANSREEALEILKRALPRELRIDAEWDDDGHTEYIVVYFNSDNVTVADSSAGMDEPDDESTTGQPTVACPPWQRERAWAEGWDLFQRDDGTLEIQHIDYPEGVGEAARIVVPVLKSDDEARQIVIEKALAGSKYHALALFLEGRNVNEQGNYLIPQALLDEPSPADE